MFQEMTFNFIGFVGSAKTETKNSRKISTLRVARTDRWTGPQEAAYRLSELVGWIDSYRLDEHEIALSATA